MLDFFDFWTKKNPDLELLFIIKYPADRLAKELEKRAWNYKVLDYSAWSGRKVNNRPEAVFRSARRNSKAILEIDKIIHQFKPNMVMTNTIVTPWAAFAAKLNSLPHIWFVREHGDIDHGHTFETSRRETFEDIGLLSELVVTNSLALKDHVSKYMPKSKVMTLYTPFNIEKIQALSEHKAKSPFSKNAQIKAVMAGILKPSKGQDRAIEAISQLKIEGYEAELCLVGYSSEPEYTIELKRLAKDKGVADRVHFVGKQANPYAFIKHADVGIMASKMEAFGRVTFEYLSLGKPVIGAASGGTLEIIKDGVNGLLYDPSKDDQIAQRLELYIKNPALLSKHHKTAEESARRMISGEYSAEVLIKKINEVTEPGLYIYKLPNFTRRWLNAPRAAEEARFKKGVVHKLRIAKQLGPTATYHEARKRIVSKMNQIKGL